MNEYYIVRLNEIANYDCNGVRCEDCKYKDFSMFCLSDAIAQLLKERTNIVKEIAELYNKNEYPEDLQCEIADWLQSKGVKI